MAVRMITVGDSSEQFISACGAAGIPATRRQWKKWLRRKGVAWAAAQKQ